MNLELVNKENLRVQNATKYFHLIMVDWAGFEPATFRLRIERSYQTELPAHLSYYFLCRKGHSHYYT